MKRLVAMMLTVIMVVALAIPAFAYSQSDVVIDYSGGQKVTDVLDSNPGQLAKMKSLFGVTVNNGVFTGNGWNDGYRGAPSFTDRYQGKYLIAAPGYQTYSNTSVTWTHNDYDVKCTILATYNYATTNGNIFLDKSAAAISNNYAVYASKNSEDTTIIAPRSGNNQIFVLFHLDFYKKGTSERIDYPLLYIRINDIDAAQSFRIINEPIKSSNSFLQCSKEEFDAPGSGSIDGYYNYLKSNGDIYSTYDIIDGTRKNFQTDDKANLFAKTTKLQTEGLDMVFGYVGGATSGINLWSQQNKITFKTTTGGTVSPGNETVWTGANATTGSTPTPDTGYKFTNWTADQDVTLSNGTVIRAGQPITMAQIKTIDVLDNISFTAHFEIVQSKLTVNWVDTEGNKLAPTETDTKDYGTPYTTSAKTTADDDVFKNYDLITTPANANGTYTVEDTEVTYVYDLKNAKVTAHYVDEDGNPIDTDEPQTGKVTKPYTTSPKDIYGYELKDVPSNKDGTYTLEDIDVTYVYRLKDASILAKHVDEAGNEIASQEAINGKVFEDYKFSPKEIYGYEIKTVPDNAEGQLKEENQDAIFVYALKDAKLTVNYVDEDGHPLQAKTEVNGKVFDPYETEELSFENYELVKVEGPASGTLTEEDIEVTYIYKLKDALVKENHYYEPVIDPDTGEEITVVEDVHNDIEGKVTEEYRIPVRPVEGYEVKGIPENAEGVMTEDTIVVDYYYVLKDADVVVHFVDEEGNPLADDYAYQGKWYEPFTSHPESIKNYHVVQTPAEEKVTLGGDTIHLTYVYAKDPAQVTSRYVDEDGNVLSDPIVDKTVMDAEYSTTPKEILGYELVEVPFNQNGTVDRPNVEVTYVYKPVKSTVVAKYVDENGKPLTDDVTTEGSYKDPYTTEPKEFPGYELVKVPANANGTYAIDSTEVVYKYVPKTAKVTAHFVDEEGNPISTDELQTAKWFTDYTTVPKEIEGYTLKAIPANQNGTVDTDEIEVTYVYIKSPEPVDEPIIEPTDPVEPTTKAPEISIKETKQTTTSAPKITNQIIKNNIPKTGDTNNNLLWGIIAVVALGGVCTGVVIYRKKDKNN